MIKWWDGREKCEVRQWEKSEVWKGKEINERINWGKVRIRRDYTKIKRRLARDWLEGLKRVATFSNHYWGLLVAFNDLTGHNGINIHSYMYFLRQLSADKIKERKQMVEPIQGWGFVGVTKRPKMEDWDDDDKSMPSVRPPRSLIKVGRKEVRHWKDVALGGKKWKVTWKARGTGGDCQRVLR